MIDKKYLIPSKKDLNFEEKKKEKILNFNDCPNTKV